VQNKVFCVAELVAFAVNRNCLCVQNVTSAAVIDASFVHAFIASLSVIIVSELGDKTFFIAAILAMRHSRLMVFTGAIAALGLMTVLSGNYSRYY